MKKLLNDSFIGKIIKTFLEGFIASLIVSISQINSDINLSFIKTIMVGAIAMGISAVLNLIQIKLNGDKNE